jgi:hypothetical protein
VREQSAAGPVEVRSYKARNQTDATTEFALDAAVLGRNGYAPTNQTWSPPNLLVIYLAPFIFMIAGYLIFGLAGFVLGGIVGIIGFVIERSRARGTLTVTYVQSDKKDSQPIVARQPDSVATTRSAVYRGATRDGTEAAYHVDARAVASSGYVPISEEWSSALGEQVLTVTYRYDPAEVPRILQALADADRSIPPLA